MYTNPKPPDAQRAGAYVYSKGGGIRREVAGAVDREVAGGGCGEVAGAACREVAF